MKLNVNTTNNTMTTPTKDNFLLNFMLGGMSGCIGKTIVAPTERIKLIMQTQGANGSGPRLGPIRPQYSGVTDCFKKVIQKEGVANLWKGNGVNTFKIFPMNAFSLALKDFFGRIIKVKDPHANKGKFLASQMLSGGLAGACTITMVFPLDFARTKLSTDVVKGGKRQYKGLFDCFSKVIQKDGIRGVYSGISTALTGVFLYKALSLGIYDYLKQTSLSDPSTSFMKKFLIANAVTQATNVLLYPLDTIGRSQMVAAGNSKAPKLSPLQCAKTILKKEGAKGFFKGLKSDMLTGIGGSLILVLYDDMKKLISKGVTAH